MVPIVLVLLLVPRVVLPRRLAAVLSTIASASLGIYLTHFALLPLQFHGVRPALLLPAGIALGVASWSVVTTALRWIVTELRARHLIGAGPAPTLIGLTSGDDDPAVAPRDARARGVEESVCIT